MLIHIPFGHISLFLGIIITGNGIAECLTFTVAGVKYPDKNQPKGERISFGSQFKVIIHHGRAVTGAWGSGYTRTTVLTQKVINDECLYLFASASLYSSESQPKEQCYS